MHVIVSRGSLGDAVGNFQTFLPKVSSTILFTSSKELYTQYHNPNDFRGKAYLQSLYFAVTEDSIYTITVDPIYFEILCCIVRILIISFVLGLRLMLSYIISIIVFCRNILVCLGLIISIFLELSSVSLSELILGQWRNNWPSVSS